MLLIKKNKKTRTTEELIRIEKDKTLKINSSQSARNAFDSLDKQILRDNIFEEQHGLCAYCMRKIDIKSFNIEHYIPINLDYQKVLDYNNMLGVCDGGESSKKDNYLHFLCCDRSRNNNTLLYVNPLVESHINTIFYTKSGEIKSRDSKIQNDLESLHLNGQKDSDGKIVIASIDLVKGRKDAYRIYTDKLQKLKPITSQKLTKLIQEEENRKEYREFEGVIVFFLKERLKRCKC